MTPQSPRQPADIIKAILANLTQAKIAELGRHPSARLDATEAFQQAITLVQIEAASLLTVTP